MANVFCKDCKNHVKVDGDDCCEWGRSVYWNDPVEGKIKRPNYPLEICRIKNSQCDCEDFKEK